MSDRDDRPADARESLDLIRDATRCADSSSGRSSSPCTTAPSRRSNVPRSGPLRFAVAVGFDATLAGYAMKIKSADLALGGFAQAGYIVVPDKLHVAGRFAFREIAGTVLAC